jgi:OPA family glycerol-3-phosphate transporter-like MFS transporter
MGACTYRWQGITLATLFTGYAGYYLCRSNLAVATPLLLDDFADSGITEKAIGGIASLGVLLYAVGKVTNGVLTDFLGGRTLFLLGMAASACCTVLFGLGSGLLVFALAWAANRYVQSMGWGALVKVSARWYPVSVQATVMGVLSMSYLLGDALGRVYLGGFIRLGVGWRGLFLLAAGTLAGIALLAWFTLKESPRDVGAEEPAVCPDNLFGAAGESARPEGLGRLLRPLLGNGVFWLVCLMNVGLTLIREAFTFWTPTYLTRAVGLDAGSAAQWSMVFPLVGAASAFLAGVVSDRARGRHGRVALPCTLLLILSLGLLSALPAAAGPLPALLLIGAVSFFLLAPYSFCSGVIALQLGGKRGGSTAAGLIDGAGYLGATLSGFGVGAVAQDHGWPTAFGVLAGVAALTALTVGIYCVVQGRDSRATRLASPVPGAAMPTANLPPGPDQARGDIIERVVRLFAEHGDAAYLGEPVSQTEHALQAAWAAEKSGAPAALVTAALLHDLGHLLHNLPEDCATRGIDDRHEELAARWLARYFGADVTEPIRLHVPAKRYLCAADPDYRGRLSPASVLSLKLQGGPMSADEVERFRRGPHAAAATALRRWDDEAKVPGLRTPGLAHFLRYLQAVLVS